MNLLSQFWALGLLVMTGVGLGFLLDLQRAWVQVLRLQGILLMLSDILYWILVTGGIFYAFFLANRGEVRFVLLISLLLGFCGYKSMLHNTIAPWCVRWMHGVYSTVQFIGHSVKLTILLVLVILQWMLYILAKPFLLIWKFLHWMGKFFQRFLPLLSPSVKSTEDTELSDEKEDL